MLLHPTSRMDMSNLLSLESQECPKKKIFGVVTLTMQLFLQVFSVGFTLLVFCAGLSPSGGSSGACELSESQQLNVRGLCTA